MAFAAPATAQQEDAKSPTPVLLEVRVNGVEYDVTPLLRDDRGRLLATKAAMTEWRLRIPASPSLVYESEAYYLLTGTDGLTASEAVESQRLELVAQPDLFETNTLSLAAERDRLPPQSEPFGAYLNYDLLGENSERRLSLGGAFEAIMFTRFGVGSATAVATAGSASRLTRLETNWTFDSPTRMASVRIGDSVTRGGTGGAPLRFGGIQYGRNFATQPGFITLPLPTASGSAATPSVVDVFINNSLADQRDVAAGPFRLNELPIVTGSGDVRLVVRDALGRETVITQSYYAASQLLRKGLHDYSYELGFLRTNYGSSNARYGALAGSATHRYGFSDNATAEAHFEATRNIQVAGFAAELLQSRLGVFSASVAASRSGDGTGNRVGIGFERQQNGYHFGARGELASRGFRNLAEGPATATATALAFVGMPTPFGSISGNYLLRRQRDGEKVQVLGGTASFRLGAIGSLQLTAQYVPGEARNRTVGLFFNRTLGVRRSASSSVELGRQGRSARATIQQGLPLDEGFAYRASMARGQIGQIEGWAAYQGSRGIYEVEASRVGGRTGVRLGASGTLGFMAGNLFAARRLTESFAQVRVEQVEGVRVYANNQLIGRTDKAGVLLIPRLLAYDANKIRIDPSDVPLDWTLSESERVVRPHLRSGVVVHFGAERLAGGMAKIVLDDGTALPSGATLTNLATNEAFAVAPGGEAYLTGLVRLNRFRAEWSGRSCEVAVPYAAAANSDAHLGTFSCRAAQILASNEAPR